MKTLPCTVLCISSPAGGRPASVTLLPKRGDLVPLDVELPKKDDSLMCNLIYDALRHGGEVPVLVVDKHEPPLELPVFEAMARLPKKLLMKNLGDGTEMEVFPTIRIQGDAIGFFYQSEKGDRFYYVTWGQGYDDAVNEANRLLKKLEGKTEVEFTDPWDLLY